MKLTDWFPGTVNPARPGVYERQTGASSYYTYRYSFWTGEHWEVSAPTAAEAYSDRIDDESSCQNLPWRGLAEKP